MMPGKVPTADGRSAQTKKSTMAGFDIKTALLAVALMAFLAATQCCGGNSAMAATPSSPEAAGATTLIGIDSDGDGVRDDAQRKIAATFGTSQRAVAAARQYAKALQATVMVTRRSQVQAVELSVLRSVSCLFEGSAPVDGDKISGLVEDWIYNTPERLGAKVSYGNLLSGMVFPLPDGTPAQMCDIDPATLAN